MPWDCWNITQLVDQNNISNIARILIGLNYPNTNFIAPQYYDITYSYGHEIPILQCSYKHCPDHPIYDCSIKVYQNIVNQNYPPNDPRYITHWYEPYHVKCFINFLRSFDPEHFEQPVRGLIQNGPLPNQFGKRRRRKSKRRYRRKSKRRSLFGIRVISNSLIRR